MRDPSDVQSLVRRIARPLPAALIFCAAGLLAAAFAIGINRVIAVQRPPVVVAVAPNASASASAAQPTAPAAPTPAATASTTGASCSSAPQAKGDLSSLTTATATTIVITGSSGDAVTLALPAGAQLRGKKGDVQAQLPGTVAQPQPVSGTLVQDLSICAQSSSGTVQVVVNAGAAVDGTATATPGGIAATDLRLRAPSGGDNGGGNGD